MWIKAFAAKKVLLDLLACIAFGFFFARSWMRASDSLGYAITIGYGIVLAFSLFTLWIQKNQRGGMTPD
jgi:hypothetical protein